MNDPLDDLLGRWTPKPASPESVEADVWRQIGRRRRMRTGLLCAAAGLAVGVGLASLVIRGRLRSDRDLQARYVEALDLRAREPADSIDATLAWMKDDLHLTPEQYARVQALHRDAQQKLVALHREIAEADRAAKALEDERLKRDRIDFIAAETLSEEERSLGRQGSLVVSNLVRATSAILDPTQRERYASAVEPSLVSDHALDHD